MITVPKLSNLDHHRKCPNYGSGIFYGAAFAESVGLASSQ